MNKEIVIVTGSMVRGGAEGVIALVANGLAQRGWHVSIVSILFNIWDYELDPAIKCIDISREKRNQLLDTPRLIFCLRRILKTIKPDAVLSFMVAVNIVTWFSSRGLNIKYIPSERNDPDKGRSNIIKKLQIQAYSASDSPVFQTTQAKSYFSERIQKKAVIIPNPVREMPMALYGTTKKIVSVGRLSSQKNHKLLIDAFSSILKIYSDFSLEIYGEGPLRTDLQQYIEEKGLSEFVYLCGKVNDVPNRIRDAYMFILSSDYEGLSNALLEAMAIGLPCVSTNCAGASDVIKDNENGLIVPVGDIDSLVKAMKYLIENPLIAKDMGFKARSSMSRFNVDSIVDLWEGLIK